MAIIAWVIGMVLLTQIFSDWQEDQYNPNQNPNSQNTNGEVSVSLSQNRFGHYVTSGSINGKPATFMLDTGATDVAIPADLATIYGLKNEGRGQSITANGIVDITKTTLKSLSIGGITLYNVRASYTAGMDRNQPILLGMSALRQLELIQKADELTLIQTLR